MTFPSRKIVYIKYCLEKEVVPRIDMNLAAKVIQWGKSVLY